MTEEAPVRWLDDPGAPDFVREALEAGRAETPDSEQLASLAAKLGPLLGGGGGPGGGGPPVDPSIPLKTAALGKGAAALVAAAVVVGGAVALWPDEPTEPPEPAPPAAPAEPATRLEPEPAVPAGVDVPDDLDPDDLEPEPATSPTPGPRYETDPAAELALIERGQRAITSSPSEALSVAAEHGRRFGPDAALAQERELIAIDALQRLGRLERARARADAFHRRWPRSAHGRRVDVILQR